MQKTILNINFFICQVVYQLSHKKIYSSKPELNNNWTKISYKRGRSTQEIPKERPNTPKKANTGSNKLPLPVAMQLY
jgi:hypothetical protein